MIPLRWHERPRKEWVFPIQLRDESGVYVYGGIGEVPEGWRAVHYGKDWNRVVTVPTREEAEAWLIAVVRLSS